MASTLNYRGGDTNEVLFATHVDHPFEKGDLLFLDPSTKTVWPAADMVNQSNAALNQDYFQAMFAGVALVKYGLNVGEKSFRLVTEETEARVATAGRFEFACASHAYTTGDLVGVYATTDGCANQQVATAASASLAIGKAVPGVAGVAGALTRVTVEIESTVMKGGVQNQVAGSGSGQ